MARRVVVWGPPAEAETVAAEIGAAVKDCGVVIAGSLGDLVAGALGDAATAVLLLGGPIGMHEERLDAIRVLRREGFVGPILALAAFLTETQDTLAAGADHAFDPDRQEVAAVVAAALQAPVVCADHAYLQALLRGEWVTVEQLTADVPSAAVDLLLVSTACHGEPGFWRALANYRAQHASTTVIVVEDEIGEDVLPDALAAGASHWFELGESGLGALLDLARSSVRGRWLQRLASA